MDTKVCGKCGKEKSEREFYRRGHGTHAICKDCWKASYSSPTSTRTTKDNSANFEAISGKIERLENRLHLTCAKYASQDPMVADDIFGFVCEKLLTTVDPKVSDTEFMVKVDWLARDYLRREKTYSFYVGSESELGGTSDETEEAGDPFEFYVSDSQNPEDAVIASEDLADIAAVVSTLSEENRTIINMLASDMSQADISREFGMTRAAITQKMDKLRTVLLSTGFMMA